MAKGLENAGSIWMCLKCGVQTCAPSNIKENPEAGHTFCHFKTPRSDLHCIFVNVETWSLFCFECKDDLYIDRQGFIEAFVNFRVNMNLHFDKFFSK